MKYYKISEDLIIWSINCIASSYYGDMEEMRVAAALEEVLASKPIEET